MSAIYKLLECEEELLVHKKLLQKFLVLGQRWAFNEMKPKARQEFLELFGEVKHLLKEESK